MKVRCIICGKIFPSETAFLQQEHDKRVHDAADPNARSVESAEWRKPVIMPKDGFVVGNVDAVR